MRLPLASRPPPLSGLVLLVLVAEGLIFLATWGREGFGALPMIGALAGLGLVASAEQAHRDRPHQARKPRA